MTQCVPLCPGPERLGHVDLTVVVRAAGSVITSERKMHGRLQAREGHIASLHLKMNGVWQGTHGQNFQVMGLFFSSLSLHFAGGPQLIFHKLLDVPSQHTNTISKNISPLIYTQDQISWNHNLSYYRSASEMEK